MAQKIMCVVFVRKNGKMEKTKLIKFFSEFWGLKSSEINDNLILNDENLHNHSSVRFYQFISALESNFDVTVNNVEDIFTFGDLIKNIADKN
jgi:acyl carrier protein